MPNNEAINQAQIFLAKQERTESELYYMLLKKGYDEEIAQEVLEESKSNGWVDDQRFSIRYCEQKICKGYGPMKITDSLRAKGLEISTIVKTISDIDFSTWEHAAMLALESKFGKNYESVEKIKLVRYLEARGFKDEYMLFLIKDDL